MFGTFPSRASSGRTSRSRSPRNSSTTTPNRWLRSLATTTGKDPSPGRPAGGQTQHLAGFDQPHGLVVHQEVLAAFELPDRRQREDQDAIDPVQREGVRLAGDRHEQGADDRHRDRQLEREPRPRAHLRRDSDEPADRPDHRLHHVEPDATPGDLGHRLLRREAGEEEEFEELGLGHRRGHRRGGEPPLDDLGPEPLRVDPPAVVGQGDLEHPRAVPGL